MRKDEGNERWKALDVRAVRAPDRKLYMQIRSILRQRKLASIPVRTEDLANVVNGREDLPLPSWATDFKLERELEDLIKRYHTIIVCFDCDHIIGFLDCSLDEGNFTVMDLMYVAIRESLLCQFCGSQMWGLALSLYLRSGEKVTKPVGTSEELHRLEPLLRNPPMFPVMSSDTNERILDQILRELYPFGPNEPTNHIIISQEHIITAAEIASGFSSRLYKAASRLPPVLYLRPIFCEDHRNVLA